MRKRKEIEKDGSTKNDLIIEILLDVRELLSKQKTKRARIRIKGGE